MICEHYLKKQHLISIGFLGNVFEWYDFSVYAYLAVIIGQLFFDANNPKIALVKAFFLFSVSYLIRPIGSFFFGYLADRYSRSLVMKVSLVVMAIPTAIIAILPTYTGVGVLATALLIFLRLIQGFAAGGELPGSACYIYESATDRKKMFYCSFVASSSMLGVLLGSIMVSILYWLFSQHDILSWAWRIPFVIGFFITLFILYIRKNIVEPKSESDEKLHYEKTKTAIQHNKWPLIQVILLNAFISIAFYLLFVWMPSYLHVFLHVSAKQAFLSSTIGLFSLIMFTLFFGYFAMKIGRRTLALCSVISIMLLSYPLFVLLKGGSFGLIIIAQLVFALCLSCIDGINMEMMASRFGRAFRGRGVSIGFTLSTAIFGGTAPTICSYLINKTGSDSSPIIFLILACLVALPAAITLNQR